jgi:hypothetical protein
MAIGAAPSPRIGARSRRGRRSYQVGVYLHSSAIKQFF